MTEKKDVKEDDSSVRVALRIRPQLAREKIDMCQICSNVVPGEPQVMLGKDKSFTFDYVFDIPTVQEVIYDACVRKLIEGCFEGYNATVFAYGQTGSGKTYTMGTGFDIDVPQEEVGIIPRAVEHLFSGIEERRRQAHEMKEPPPDFKVNAQFIELYNEEILDLLDTTRDPESRGRKSHIKVHEDATGGIYVVGVTTRPVCSLEDTMNCLKNGALSRATASTNMNAQSSRSHAIFTLHIKQHRVVKDESGEDEEGKDTDSTQSLNEFETLTAKFHFVDLAGSERLKRTGATGDRAKEGISINCGLLALGNVISALGDKSKKGFHVPYRDSKLTRLLQDSLGGNSRTLMIACISPSDRDFIETLNTLKYANRARNIKNKVMANQDKASKQLAVLRAEILTLQQELMEYKTGKRTVDGDGVESVNDMFHENTMLQTENDKLRQRIKALHETVESLTSRNAELLAEKDMLGISNISEDAKDDEVKKLIEGYIKDLEDLRGKLSEAEAMAEQFKRKSLSSRMGTSMSMVGSSMSVATSGLLSPVRSSMSSSLNLTPADSTLSVLDEAKKDVRRLKKVRKSKKKICRGSDKENISDNEKDQNEADTIEEEAGDEVIKPDNEQESEEENTDDINGDLNDNDEDDDDEEELEELTSGESESEDKDSDNLHEDLAELTCEISIKQKLVEELEQSQRKLQAVKHQYEEKVIQLQQKIRATEDERDKVLSNIGAIESVTSEKVKKVGQEYQKKLQNLQTELKKMQAAKREHSKLVKNQSHYEKQLKTLQHELSEMKKTKVKLMKQVKDEAEKGKASEARRNKEVAQLRKDQLRKENMIRNLEKEKKQKDVVLRRKQEELKVKLERVHSAQTEVEALRKRDKKVNMSAKAAGRIGRYDRPNTIPIDPTSSSTRRRRRTNFSAKAAKQKWTSLERNISTVIIKKQTISHMEKDMDIWLKQREKMCKKLDKYCKKRDLAIKDVKEDSVIKDLTDVIENLRNQVQYAQENISECQTNIMQMEETKDEGDSVDVSAVISSCSGDESKYILEHFIQQAILRGLALSQKDAEVRELQAQLHQTELNNTLQQDLLKHMINDRVDIEVDNLMTNAVDDMESSASSSSSSPAESMFETRNSVPNVVSQQLSDTSNRREKVRRKTPLPQELLYADGSNTPLLPLPETPEEEEHQPEAESVRNVPDPPRTHPDPPKSQPDPPRKQEVQSTNGVTDVALMPPPKQSMTGLCKVPSSSNLSRVGAPTRPDPGPSPSLRRKEFPRPSPEPSPVLRRKNNSSSSLLSRSSSVYLTVPLPKSRRNGKERPISDGNIDYLHIYKDTTTSSDTTPPSSPTTTRRTRDKVVDDNVFSRLTSNTRPPSLNPPNRGTIMPNTGKIQTNKLSPLVCTHIAEGHIKPVLSVDATDDLLFTSSKDRTAKIWDLHTGKEIQTFSGHPNNVVCVKYCAQTKLVFTVSHSYINVYDIRSKQKPCIKTLSSSGLTHDGPVNFGSYRQIDLPPGEHHINDIALNEDGTCLYSATGSVVRVWDLKSAIGKLNAGHQAAVMVLAVDRKNENDIVLTGSKDHYIKMFEVLEERAGVMTPKYNLEPPHYDGIQSLALQGDILFSGSRDTCIKKWDLTTQQLKQSINSAHKDWICALEFLPGSNVILSGCRGGFLKLWNVDTCQPMGEIKAHSSPINAIATNSTSIFTASNDHTVGIWHIKSGQDINENGEGVDEKQII